MDHSTYAPVAVTAKTHEELSKKFLLIQVKESAKLSIVTIYYDSSKKEHVLWYYPYRNLAGGVM